eukprot:m.84041 g.84041  ORF g.84041 m.84041 type:complete len:226 (+) comp14786_c0_seq1:193-870(+)
MSDEEKSLLSGSAGLYPSRVTSTTLQQVEFFVGLAAVVLAIASCVYCIVMGLKGIAEHILMGAVIALVTTMFVMIYRLYRKDILQDRVVVYLSLACVIAVSAAGLLYASHWGSSNPFQGCTKENQYFGVNAKPVDGDSKYGGGSCLTLQKPQASSLHKCFMFNGSVTESNLTTSPLAPHTNNTIYNCTDIYPLMQTCFGQRPSIAQGWPAACIPKAPTPPPPAKK